MRKLSFRLGLAGLALAALSLGAAFPAQAALITLYYRATVTEITHTNGGYGDTTGYVVGGTTHGTITFNDDASDSQSDPNYILFRATNTPIPLSLSITSNAGASSFDVMGTTPSLMSIRDNYITGGLSKDQVYFNTINDSDQIILGLYGEVIPPAQPTLLTTMDLTLPTLDISQATRTNRFALVSADPNGLLPRGYSNIIGEITYLAATPVPLPATLPLFVSGIALLGLLTRKRKTA